MRIKKLLCCMLATVMLIIATPIAAQASPPRQIPYDHVLSRIISRDPAVTPLDRELRDANNTVRSANTAVRHFRHEPSMSIAAREANIHLLQVTAERDFLQRERNHISISAEMQLRRHLVNIARYEADIRILEYTLALQEGMLQRAEQLHRRGFVIASDVVEARQAIELSNLNMEMLEFFLQSERQQLNRLTNHPLDSHIRITYTVDDSALVPEDGDIEYLIAQVVDRYPCVMIWRANERIRHHELQIQLNTARNRYGEGHRMSPATEVINSRMRRYHQSAILERDTAKRQAELQVRSALAHWEQLVEQQQILELSLAQAIREYEDMQARFNAGFATQIQVDSFAVDVAVQEIMLEVHSYEFWIARMMVMHPYV